MTQKVSCLGWKSAILIVAALRARNRLKPGLRTTLRTVCRVRSPGFSRSEPKMRSAGVEIRFHRDSGPDNYGVGSGTPPGILIKGPDDNGRKLPTKCLRAL